MPRIEISTRVRAPIEVVFDLSRSIDAHLASQHSHGERVVAGRASGLIECGETVTWEAVHLGIRQRLGSRITAMTRPSHFRDSMTTGAFARFDHDHFYEEPSPGETKMRDVFDYTSPFSIIGGMADFLFLKRYMARLLTERNEVIRQIAESGDFEKYFKG